MTNQPHRIIIYPQRTTKAPRWVAKCVVCKIESSGGTDIIAQETLNKEIEIKGNFCKDTEIKRLF